MFIFVSGAARSGKSAWAERAALSLSRGIPRVYLATARVTDGGMLRRIQRHRASREGLGFRTVERPRGLSGAPASIPEGSAVLLECLTHWAANEMFREDGRVLDAREVRDEIYRAAMGLRVHAGHLLIVSNDVFSDGTVYDAMTEAYVRLLGELHVLLVREADAAVECAGGLARVAKGEALLRLAGVSGD